MKKILRKLRSALASAWDFILLLFVLAAFGEPEDYPSAVDEYAEGMLAGLQNAAGEDLQFAQCRSVEHEHGAFRHVDVD